MADVAAATAATAAAAPVHSLGVWWLRRDLRLADNEALHGAVRGSDALLPVYCFDPREVAPRRPPPEGLGVPRLGPLRCRFLLEGLHQLHRDMSGYAGAGMGAEAPGAASGPGGAGSSSGLVVRFGCAERVLPALLEEVRERNRELRSVSLHHHCEAGEEGAEAEARVAEALGEWAASRGVALSLHTYWDRTLYHPDDLPYHLYEGRKRPSGAQWQCPPNRDRARFRSIPNVMTDFRKAAQAAARVRTSLPPPPSLPPLPPPFDASAPPPTAPPAISTAVPAPPAAAAAPASAPANACAGADGLTCSRVQDPEALPVSETGSPADSVTPTAEAADSSTEAAGPGRLVCGLPGSVGEVYAALGVEAAVRRLEGLVGREYGALLAAPVGGVAGSEAGACHDPRAAFPFLAGEAAALRRLRYYVWGSPEGPQQAGPQRAEGRLEGAEAAGSSPLHRAPVPPSLQYFTNTRAQAVGVDSSTKLSPFVALGCISPRRIHEEVELVRAAAQTAEAVAAPGAGATGEAAAPAVAASGAGNAGGAGAGAAAGSGGGAAGGEASTPPAAECDWLAMHLCIRDFFIFTALKAGPSMLDERGIVGAPVEWRRDEGAFARWARGTTGLPFVDACMRELAATGWMSNRGRQNVASLLTKDLRVDWRWGAELFKCLLLDADEAVNYCNWNYFAGIGNDPRNRHFKTVTQGIKYDEDAQLAAAWLPELAALPPPLRHQPWTASEQDAARYGVVLGRDYPLPMVDPAGQVGKLGGPDRGARGKAGSGGDGSNNNSDSNGKSNCGGKGGRKGL